MKIEEQATSLSLFGIFLSDRPIRMAAVLVSSFQLPQFNRKILFPPVAKEFGSVGVIGNPMGFVRNVGIDLKDFLAVTAKGTTSLLSNTIYATSDAAAQGNPMGFARMLGSTSKISYQLLPRVFCRMAPGLASLLSNTVYAISDAAAQDIVAEIMILLVAGIEVRQFDSNHTRYEAIVRGATFTQIGIEEISTIDSLDGVVCRVWCLKKMKREASVGVRTPQSPKRWE
ncbi:hypothetical protein HHK36_011207 [Tetracentron sinense]|uniref:Uncharacterized protein n=1 Tax=Tetracentron sinense TaxID=13715 RepID=A0A835DFZ0_TETSI|nr:hypothetical protein HHK36_011207 [Tetracentron sinense]